MGILADHGIREGMIFSDVASGRTMNRTGWTELMSLVQPGDTIVVAFLDRFSRNFEEGVRIQAELTGRDIGIVTIRENINTSDGSAAAKFFRRSMLAQGAYQVDSASERIRLGLGPGPGRGKQVGRPPALTQEQIGQRRRMAEEGADLRQIPQVMTCSPVTVKAALDVVADGRAMIRRVVDCPSCRLTTSPTAWGPGAWPSQDLLANSSQEARGIPVPRPRCSRKP